MSSKSFSLAEEKGEDIMKEQESRKIRRKMDKRMPEASCVCTLERIGRDISAKEELLTRDESVSPTRLREMINKEINDSIKQINNSIKDAVRTLVKCSMEEKKSILPCSEEPKGISDACRSRVKEEHDKKSLDVCTNRQSTCHASRQRNNLFTHDNSYLCTKMHETAIPLSMQNKINGEGRSKNHSKSANNVNNDNRRMTGNVNIYICSETKDNDQGKEKSRSQFYPDTSFNTITEQSNSRSACSASSCKLINSIKKKRKKLLAQQLPNFIHEKISGDNIYDNRTTRHRISRKESSEAASKEEADVKVNDENVRCKNTTSLTKDGCDCKDTDSVDLQRDPSHSIVPCSSFSACDNTGPQSWITIYPTEARARPDDSDVFLPRAICTNVEQRSYYKRNDSEYAMCHAVDGSRWLPKSTCTDCAAYSEESKECLVNSCEYRNKILWDSVINRNDTWKRPIGCKLLPQSLGSCQREQVQARQRSTCSCIAEEKDDYFKGVDGDRKDLPKNICDVTECLEKISVCRGPLLRKSTECAAVRETSFCAPAGEHLEKTRPSEDSTECLKGTGVRGTKFGNSEEPPKVTGVSKEFDTEGPLEDITACNTVLGEPNGLPEEEIVYNTALADSKGAPKETICKVIPDSNFANQDDVDRVSLNDAKDKPVGESTNSFNLNGPERNARNKEIVNIALNSFTEQRTANSEQDKEIKKAMNNESNNSHRIPVESIRDSISLSKNNYSTLNRVHFYDRSNLASNFNGKRTSKAVVNQRRIQSRNKSVRNQFRQSLDLRQELALNKNNQLKEKPREKSKHEDKKQNTSKEMKTTEDKQRDPLLLYRGLLKKLIDIIRRRRRLITDKVEIGKSVPKETINDDKKDVKRSETASEIEDKINDIKDQQEITKEIAAPMTPPQTEIANRGKKIDIQRTDQPMPKLLRIIAAKRSRVLPTVVTTDSNLQGSEVVSAPAEIITIVHVEQEEIPEEKVSLQEDGPAEVTEEIKADDSIVPEGNVAATETSVIDTRKDVADKDRVSQDILDEAVKTRAVASPQKEPEEKSRSKSALCKCGLPYGPSGCSCSIAKCPQKKSKEEPQKSILCKAELPPNSNNHSRSIVKCTKCDSIIENRPFKDNRFEQREIYCPRCHLLTMRCTCTSYLESCLKTDIPKFHGLSPLKISSHIRTDCCRMRKEPKCRKTTICCHSREECSGYKWYATRGNYSRIIDKRKCDSQASCIKCCRPRNQCCPATLALVKCHKIKEGRNRENTMICLYCDNSRDKCTCRAPIGKCLYCGLPSDVCNCQGDEGHARDCEQIARRPDENRTIRVTSWKPRREIRRYFARNYEDCTEECRCYGKPGRQRPDELPYQRLNIFSEVMNELQQKMSESICCARCWRNPCCCELPVDQDKRKEKRKAEARVKLAETEKFSRSTSPNDCRCSSRNVRESIQNFQKAIPNRHIGCVCKITPCRCKKERYYKRPLAKCYYCKSLPCICITMK